MNDVVVMMERNRRNNLTANFSVTKGQCKEQCSDLQWEFTSNRKSFLFFFLSFFFFCVVEVRGLKINYDLTGIGIGLKQLLGLRD